MNGKPYTYYRYVHAVYYIMPIYYNAAEFRTSHDGCGVAAAAEIGDET